MTIKEQIKILDDKIRQYQADYDLYRENAKISALRSGKLDKYEYLTVEDLGYRPNPVQKAKFEYSSLGQVFNKELDFNEKNQGLLKRLKNIEDKTNTLLRAIEGQKDVQNVEGAIDNQLQPAKDQRKVKKTDKGLKLDWVHNPAKDLDTLMNEINNNSTLFTVINNERFNLTKLKNFLKDVIDHKIKNKKDAKERYLKSIYNGRKLIKETIINNATNARNDLLSFIDRTVLAVFGPNFINIQQISTGTIMKKQNLNKLPN